MSEYDIGNHEKRLHDSRLYWDHLASTFDNEPDHGLRVPLILQAWIKFLKTWLPYETATTLDIGCGTGSLSVVLAGLGHKVTGIDLSPAMISLARAKAAARGFQIEFHVMDAIFPQLPHQYFNVIVCRHLLWALPEPEQVLLRWSKLLKQKGRLLLIEGYWNAGAGLHLNEVVEMLPSSFTNISIQNLSNIPNLWGKDITDERYAIIADINR